MKKKQFFLFLVCVGSLNAYSLQIANPHYNYAIVQTDEVDPIDLKGKFIDSGKLRINIPIVAEKQNSTIFVQFQTNVGILQVSITGKQGQVYTASVDTAMQSILSIPLAGYSQGSYTITFSNERGSMWGDFTL